MLARLGRCFCLLCSYGDNCVTWTALVWRVPFATPSRWFLSLLLFAVLSLISFLPHFSRMPPILVISAYWKSRNFVAAIIRRLMTNKVVVSIGCAASYAATAGSTRPSIAASLIYYSPLSLFPFRGNRTAFLRRHLNATTK